MKNEIDKSEKIKEIPFDFYIFGKTVSMKNIDVTVELKQINPNMEDFEIKMMEEIWKDDLQKLLNRKIKVNTMNEKIMYINNPINYISDLTLNDWDYEIKLNNEKTTLKEIRELLEKREARKEIEQLMQSKNKFGDFYSFGKSAIRKFYFQEEARFKEFQGLMINNNFCLPDDDKKQKELIKYLNKIEPGSGVFAKNFIPTVAEMLERNGEFIISKKKLKKLKNMM